MNKKILFPEVQTYLDAHLQADAAKVALAKPAFDGIGSSELAGQLSSKQKAQHKLPTWFTKPNIYYPPPLSIEQTSSEVTASYKSTLAIGPNLIDLTAGFGVDSYFFAQKVKKVVSCEINPALAVISAYNAKVLHVTNLVVEPVNGLDFLQDTNQVFQTIYIDPARRSSSNKVFKLKDCTPDVTQYLDLFLTKAERTIIKTAPLLDLTAGLSALRQVSEIHIVSVKNECKELLWVLDRSHTGTPKVICATLNQEKKRFTFQYDEQQASPNLATGPIAGFLYEPDVALLKSGAFNLIGETFKLRKLHPQSQLYCSGQVNSSFLGRIFEIESVLQFNEFKKGKNWLGNVIVRNFPEQAQQLVKKYQIRPSHDNFLIFTQTVDGYVVIKTKILQYY
ncbi:MAG: hypothetical protein REI78_00500 [Pedobacter sp.]|nr:hypothetical protein [Pedobacter sp.]MDQ8051466.1 hypothetical protein [Pedobacter sp.]